MNRVNLIGLGLLTLVGALPALVARADEVKKVEKQEPGKGKFQVYGGNCSRSWRLLGGYENISAACAAAAQFREKNKVRVEVTMGTNGGWYFGTQPAEFQIYRRLCRAGWQLHSTTKSAEKATETAEGLKKDGNPIEIVRCFAAK